MKTFSEIYNTGMAELAAKYCQFYKDNPKNFITCFLKFRSIRTECRTITTMFPIESDKDFTDYCNKFELSEADRSVLNKTLQMIYETTKE